MKEAPKFDKDQLFRFIEDAQSYREGIVYVETVEQIEALAFEFKQKLLNELKSLEPTPMCSFKETKIKFSGILVEGWYVKQSVGVLLIVLLPDEGMVEVPWEIVEDPWKIDERSEIPLWDKRREISAQDYLRFAPKAALEIDRLKRDGVPSQPEEINGSDFLGVI